jgi:hypothetical protein
MAPRGQLEAGIAQRPSLGKAAVDVLSSEADARRKAHAPAISLSEIGRY